MKTRLLKKLRKASKRIVRLHQKYDKEGYSYSIWHRGYTNDRCEDVVYKNKDAALDALYEWRNLYIFQRVCKERNKILDI